MKKRLNCCFVQNLSQGVVLETRKNSEKRKPPQNPVFFFLKSQRHRNTTLQPLAYHSDTLESSERSKYQIFLLTYIFMTCSYTKPGSLSTSYSNSPSWDWKSAWHKECKILLCCEESSLNPQKSALFLKWSQWTHCGPLRRNCYPVTQTSPSCIWSVTTNQVARQQSVVQWNL